MTLCKRLQLRRKFLEKQYMKLPKIYIGFYQEVGKRFSELTTIPEYPEWKDAP